MVVRLYPETDVCRVPEETRKLDQHVRPRYHELS